MTTQPAPSLRERNIPYLIQRLESALIRCKSYVGQSYADDDDQQTHLERRSFLHELDVLETDLRAALHGEGGAVAIPWSDYWQRKGRTDVSHDYAAFELADEWRRANLATPPAESREARMVVLRRDINGTPTVWCDPEIADLVAALNDGGVPTVASCSGHGTQHGNIALADGREILIAPNFATARNYERAIATLAPAAGSAPTPPTTLRELAEKCRRLAARCSRSNDIESACAAVHEEHASELDALAARMEAGEAVAWRVPTHYGVGYNFASEGVMRDMADWLSPAPVAAKVTGENLRRVVDAALRSRRHMTITEMVDDVCAALTHQEPGNG